MGLSELREALAAKKAEKQGYLDIAEKIGEIYDRLSEDKAAIKAFRDDIKEFKKTEYETFVGDKQKNVYVASVSDLLDNYKTVIDNIDTNMDRLNDKKCDYKNKAAGCDPIIGGLEAAINRLITEIQNATN